MLVKLLIRLSALSLGLSYATCTTPQQQSQLATLHERMNQMISALYSSPLLSKAKVTASSEETSTPPQETYSHEYPAAPGPRIVYVSPPTYLEAGAQPTDYGYPSTTSPVARAAWPYPYDSYQPQYAPPVYSPPLSRPYPEYVRAAYPQLPSPHAIPPPFPSPVSYGPFSSQYPAPFSLPYHPGYSVAPTLAPYLPMSPPSPIPYPPPYPSLPYPPPSLSFSLMPHQYAPSLSYPSSVPAPYPPMNSSPYSPTLSYPLIHHLASPTFPKPSDLLPQPPYEYS